MSASKDEFIEGPILNRSLALRGRLYGVGINDATYSVYNSKSIGAKVCPYYLRWANMLRRCYSPLFHESNKTYRECSVVNDWLVFSNFRRWMEAQDWKGKELDKDIKVLGNLIYGPDTCLFISAKVNLLIAKRDAGKKNLPQGVCLSNRKKPYRAYITSESKQVHLGIFYTVDAAREAYILARNILLAEESYKEENSDIAEYIMNHCIETPECFNMAKVNDKVVKDEAGKIQKSPESKARKAVMMQELREL